MMSDRACMIGLVALIGLSHAAWADQACTRLPLGPGHTSTVVKGMAPPSDWDGPDEPEGPCYELAAEAGQTALLKIKGQNVALSVENIVSDQDKFRFKTEKRIYKIFPMQTLRSRSTSPFTMTVSLK